MRFYIRCDALGDNMRGGGCCFVVDFASEWCSLERTGITLRMKLLFWEGKRKLGRLRYNWIGIRPLGGVASRTWEVVGVVVVVERGS